MGSEGQTPLQVGRRAHLRHVSRPDPATGTQVPAHHAPVEEARIRVVQLVATGSGGGAQEHVATLLAHLDRTRFEVRVISLSDGSAVSRWRASGVETEVLSVTDEGRLGHEVAARLADWRTQVVHGHMYLAELVGARAVRTLEVQGLPRPFLVNHIHSSRTRSTDDRERLTDLDPWVDHLIAVSEAIRAKLAAERPRRPRVSLIPNGVDTDRFHPAHGRGALSASLAIPPSARVVGCVARLEPEKGHETLLDAWPRVLERDPRCPPAHHRRGLAGHDAASAGHEPRAALAVGCGHASDHQLACRHLGLVARLPRASLPRSTTGRRRASPSSGIATTCRP